MGNYKSGGIAEGSGELGTGALISVPLLYLFHSSLQTHCAENLLKADTYRKWRAAKAGEKTISVVLQVILPSPCLLPDRRLETQGPDTALQPTGSGLTLSLLDFSFLTWKMGSVIAGHLSREQWWPKD